MANPHGIGLLLIYCSILICNASIGPYPSQYRIILCSTNILMSVSTVHQILQTIVANMLFLFLHLFYDPR
ncbi:hypothetical protein BGZ60DRAFT_409084 [Tricladium varicosporioides]|nr:hypothetical protein BGZ60DRAFT_409084 [Hymenoscyphus varicosporioides]